MDPALVADSAFTSGNLLFDTMPVSPFSLKKFRFEFQLLGSSAAAVTSCTGVPI